MSPSCWLGGGQASFLPVNWSIEQLEPTAEESRMKAGEGTRCWGQVQGQEQGQEQVQEQVQEKV